MFTKFADSISEDIFNRTVDWDLKVWKDFRNNFCEDYYEIRDADKSSTKIYFKKWKLDKIIKYNREKR